MGSIDAITIVLCTLVKVEALQSINLGNIEVNQSSGMSRIKPVREAQMLPLGYAVPA